MPTVGQPSTLFFHSISSEEGTQQGVLSSSQAELNLGYTDDVTLGSSVENVASDVAEIIRAC